MTLFYDMKHMRRVVYMLVFTDAQLYVFGVFIAHVFEDMAISNSGVLRKCMHEERWFLNLLTHKHNLLT